MENTEQKSEHQNRLAKKKVLIYCNTQTIQLIGIHGAMKHLKKRVKENKPIFFRLDIPHVIGVM